MKDNKPRRRQHTAVAGARIVTEKQATMQPVHKSQKLANVCYDIRGPVLEHAKKMEDEGHRIIKLNIGNPAPFGFFAPDEIIEDVIVNLPSASGYSDSKGLFAARKAIMHYAQEKQLPNVSMDDIIIGNGVSELIVMAMQALLDNGDEVLVPARTIRCGRLQSAWPVARRCIMSVTKSRAGSPASTTSAPRSPPIPAPSW
jgi:alanine-synthesizing transaminase